MSPSNVHVTEVVEANDVHAVELAEEWVAVSSASLYCTAFASVGTGIVIVALVELPAIPAS